MAIYGNIYHQYTPNIPSHVSIYASTMDPSWDSMSTTGKSVGRSLTGPWMPRRSLCRDTTDLSWKWLMWRSPMHQIVQDWLVVYLPLWKIWVRQLGWWNSQYDGKVIKFHGSSHHQQQGPTTRGRRHGSWSWRLVPYMVPLWKRIPSGKHTKNYGKSPCY